MNLRRRLTPWTFETFMREIDWDDTIGGVCRYGPDQTHRSLFEPVFSEDLWKLFDKVRVYRWGRHVETHYGSFSILPATWICTNITTFGDALSNYQWATPIQGMT